MTTETVSSDAAVRDFIRRIDAGEFDGGDKYHRFVVNEIYPLLSAGGLTVKDLERITRAWSARAAPPDQAVTGVH